MGVFHGWTVLPTGGGDYGVSPDQGGSPPYLILGRTLPVVDRMCWHNRAQDGRRKLSGR